MNALKSASLVVAFVVVCICLFAGAGRLISALEKEGRVLRVVFREDYTANPRSSGLYDNRSVIVAEDVNDKKLFTFDVRMRGAPVRGCYYEVRRGTLYELPQSVALARTR